jgi:enolase-phosphatase E1
VSGDLRAVLLDIEGTTTSVRFVYDVLFPFARERVSDFLRETADDPDTMRDVARLRDEHAAEDGREGAPPAWSDGPGERTASAARYALWLMDRDRKSTALKSLQGRIWERGYRDGRLVSHVYDDVPPALRRWREEGRSVHIFSSGSVLAQELLFAHTAAGDLTPWIDGWFDTTTGPKRAVTSYLSIAEALGQPTAAVLFVSDVQEELDAARDAGMRTALAVRDGEPPTGPRHPVVRTFDGLPAGG